VILTTRILTTVDKNNSYY